MATTAKQVDPLKDLPGLKELMWEKVTAAAEKYNEPGRFTALIGFEWTSMPEATICIATLSSATERTRPTRSCRSLNMIPSIPRIWTWMAAYEKKTGGRVLAIAHNGNLSNGLMFDDVTYDKEAARSRLCPAAHAVGAAL